LTTHVDDPVARQGEEAVRAVAGSDAGGAHLSDPVHRELPRPEAFDRRLGGQLEVEDRPLDVRAERRLIGGQD